MAEVQTGPTRAVRGLVWAYAVLAVTVLLAGGLFVVSQILRALGESFCIAETRLPADAGTVSGPTFVDPVHLRCDYGDAGSRVFFFWTTPVEVGVVVAGVVVAVGLVLWGAHTLSAVPVVRST